MKVSYDEKELLVNALCDYYNKNKDKIKLNDFLNLLEKVTEIEEE